MSGREAAPCSQHALSDRTTPSPFLSHSRQVLFVLSADRPLTESEVRFLQYVRQWGKKVVFVVNKVRPA